LLVCLFSAALSISASARPERIRAGYSYYSDGYSVQGAIYDLAEEKNYEEVYQSYRYYEARYDEAGRVVRFVEYVRGEMARTEEYRYGDAGALIERIVRRPGKEAEITRPGDGDAGGDRGAAP
jgi:hypothetical protein